MDSQEASLIKKKKYRRKFFNIKDGYSLVKFINKIPNLQQIKFRLSDEECEVVGQDQNLLVIGRSGTGKTTCALMRLFSIEMIYKNSKAKERHITEGETTPYLCRARYIDQSYGIKNLFLAVSPLLINQIRAKYEELKMHVKVELNIIEQRKSYVDNNQSQNRQQAPRFGMNDINDAQRNQRQRQLKYTTFHRLDIHDYPGFFTVKEFLVMLDGALVDNFFIRGQNKLRIFNNKRVEVNNDNKNFKVNINGNQCFAKECKWDIFSKQFWDKTRVKRLVKQKQKYSEIKFRQITDITVWTEILSTIKGHFESHNHPGKYLPLKRYIQLSKNKFLRKQQKEIVYSIFLEYQAWKDSYDSKYFDLLDLVNHLLCNIRNFYQYQNFQTIFFNQIPVQFHYLFLDQIQDVPPVVPYLISQLFTDGIYFSRDSAQAIQKGVSFKFSDLKYMFQKEFAYPPLFFKNPSIHALTENFRSHENILFLANSLIRILVKLFPDSIDNLKKQTSQLRGPKPILLDYQCEQTIKYLLIEDNLNVLDSNTAIIVRNKEVAQALPNRLQQLKGLVLTVQQSKGMQFDNVIMYNFFDPKLAYLWKVLKYCQMYPRKGSKQYHIQEINIEDYIQIITEIKQLYTLVTRAKCTLILYQQHLPEQLRLIWHSQDLIYTRTESTKMKEQKSEYEKSLKRFAKKISWEERGYNFYMNREYTLAYQCYHRAGMQDVCNKILAIQEFIRAQQMLQALRLKYKVEDLEAKYSQEELEQHKVHKEYKLECSNKVYPVFKQAALKFVGIKIFTQAADCYYQMEDYDQALKNYKQEERQQNHYKIAFCFEKKGLQVRKQLKQIKQEIKRKDKEKQIAQCLKKAAQYYRQSKKYPQMLEALEKLNDYKYCMSQIKQCGNFAERQVYFRKYAHILINKEYSAIDKMQSRQSQVIPWNDSDITSLCYLNQINLFQCQYQLKVAKDKLNKLPKNLYYLHTQICGQIEYCLRYFLESKCQKQLNSIDMIDEQIKKNRLKLRQYQSHIDRLPVDLLKRSEHIVQLVILEQINIAQKQQLRRQQYKKISKAIQEQALRMHQKIQEFYLTFSNFINHNLLGIGTFKQLLNTFRKIPFVQTNFDRIFNQVEKQISRIHQECQNLIMMVRKIILQMDGVDFQAQNWASFQDILKDFIQIGSSQKIYEITESLRNKYISRFDHFIDQQKKRLNFISSERIYLHNHKISYYHIIRSQQLGAQMQKERLILKNVIEQYSQSRLSPFSQGQILKFSQRREIETKNNSTWKFKQVNHLAIEREIQNRRQYMPIKDINQLEIISPRGLIGLSILHGFKQKAIQCLIAEMSYHSRCYSKKSTIIRNSNYAETNKDIERFVTFINPRFFQFSMFRTNYRLQFAGNQLIEAIILLGLNQSFEYLLPEQLNKQLCGIYVNKRKAVTANQKIQPASSKENQKLETTKQQCKEIGKKQEKPQLLKNEEKQPAKAQEEMCEQFKILNLLHQIAFMDCVSQDSWYCSSKENIQTGLTADEREQINCRVQQKKQLRRDKLSQHVRIKQKEFNDKVKYEIEYQIQLRKKEYQKLNVMVSPRKDDNYDQIKNQRNIDEITTCYQSQIQAYKNLIKQLRKKTYENINLNNSTIYRQFNSSINQILFEVQRIVLNEEYKFQEQQKNQYYQIQAQFQNLKYQFIENPIRDSIKDLSKKSISLCKKRVQGQVSKLLQEKIYDEIDIIRNICFDAYNRIKSTDQFKQYVRDKVWIYDNPIAIIREKCRGFKIQRDDLHFETTNNSKKLQDQLKNEQFIREIIKYETEGCKCKKRKRYDQLTIKLLKLDKLIQLLFIQESPKELIEHFIELCAYGYDNNYGRVQILLIYFAYYNYSRLSKIVESHVEQSRLILFKNYLDNVTFTLQDPCFNKTHFQFYRSLLTIFDANMIYRFAPMSIFENFVLVKAQSILLKNPAFQNEKGFCFLADQEQQVYLMRLSTVSSLLSQHIYSIRSGSTTYIPCIGSSQLAAAQLFHLVENQNKIPPKLQKTMMTIEEQKCSILTFFYQNQFVSHQSSLFVYHQLKAYYDLIYMIRSIRSHSNQFLENHLKGKIENLQGEFRDWKKYAQQFEIYKKINRNQ